MKHIAFASALTAALIFGPVAAAQVCPYDERCLDNPYGAGSPYRTDGLMNPYSRYGSEYSNQSWRNPYATNAPRIYDENGEYRGRLSTNRYDPDSISNPYGRYGSRYSSESLNNPYRAGGSSSGSTLYIVPCRSTFACD